MDPWAYLGLSFVWEPHCSYNDLRQTGMHVLSSIVAVISYGRSIYFMVSERINYIRTHYTWDNKTIKIPLSLMPWQ
jgi:hypothetical protein